MAEVIRVIDMLGDKSDPGDPQDPNRRDSLRAISFDEGGNLYATNRARSQACVEGEAGCNPGVLRQRISIVRMGDDFPSGTIALDPGSTNPGPAVNPCFTLGGYVVEYLIDTDHIDGAGGLCTGDPADGFGAGEGVFMRVLLSLICVFALIACQQESAESGNSAGNQAGHQAPGGRVTKYGLYEVIRTGRLVDNADTSTGKSHSASTIQYWFEYRMLVEQKFYTYWPENR